ncbi:MAG: DinB/UmuC family translesion DNA polymerase, partial [Candidatus Limnocylindrales bacterium]
KSVGHEHTFDIDTSDPETIERTLLGMADGVAGRLRSAGVRASTVTVKIRDSSFRTITRQRTLAQPTDMTEPIFRAALELARPEVRGIRVRLLGVTASNLGEREQLSLFESGEPRRRRAVEAADSLRHRYGDRAVTRARLLGAGLPAPFERDPRNPLDRRARGRRADPGDASDVTAGGAALPGRDSVGDTDADEIPPDDA